jgi:hypothetical protein
MKAMNPTLGQRRVLAALAVLTLTVVSGCTDKRDGTALPASSSPNAAPSQPNTGPNDVFAALKACDALDRALQGQGFSPAVPQRAGGANCCDAKKAQYGGVSLALQPDLGIDDLKGDRSKQHDGDVNGRRAIQTRDGIEGSGTCDIVIEVTKTSRAFVVASLSVGTTDEACTFVDGVAKKVEPQLPKGN